MSPSIRSDLTGRIIGMIVFLLGVGLLCVVFHISYTLFNATPTAALGGLRFTGNPKTDPSVAAIGSRFGVLLMNVVYLVIMSIAGSLIAQSGIKLYFSSLKGPAHDVVHHPVTVPIHSTPTLPPTT